jgi:guanosine-3',5'-bis(diphosphate) 3'-pyrophosphohydrolase
MVVTYAKCCRPIPGDPIVGFLSAGRGIVVHREGCKNIAELRRYPEKYIFIQWADDVQGEFQVEIRVDVMNQRGVLAILANSLSDNDANIVNVHIDERDNRLNSISFLVNIRNRIHLARIFKNLRSIEGVTRVLRVK